ncbi:MAG: hypothetical protein GX752_00825 [Clostridium sp.]|nr:hypothetical protein [Clostridium sp.]
MDATFRSFEVIDSKIIIKKIDKSILKYGEIRIPNDLRDFFGLFEMEKYEREEISIKFKNLEYEAVIYIDNFARRRGKLRWGRELGLAINESVQEYLFLKENKGKIKEEIIEKEIDLDKYNPLIRIEKNNEKHYKFELIFPSEMEIDIEQYKLHEDKFIYGVRSRYELDPKIRLEALKYHGMSCKICGFNYESTYGELGKGYIQIHHKYHDDNSSFDIDIKKDIIPICDNCHSMIHRNKYKNIDSEELEYFVSANKEYQRLKK